jgi:tetratricopeptide (TPR) repeat protein
MDEQGDRFDDAVRNFRAGSTDKARRICEAILAREPRNFDATHLLAVVQLQRGAAADAESLFRRAIEINPFSVEAWNNHGTALKTLKRNAEAAASYDRAVALNPESVSALSNRANLHTMLGRPRDALADYDRALELESKDAAIHYNRAGALHALDRLGEAVESYDKALALKPDFPQALNNRGNVLKELHRFDEALESFDRALELNPLFADAIVNRGNVLVDLGRPAEALASYDSVIALDPAHTRALNNRGVALRALARFDEAIESYGRAIAIDKTYAEPVYNRGVTRLLAGDWKLGWEEYESRFFDKVHSIWRPDVSAAEWNGEPLKDKTILVFTEQGYGDSIQFIRFLRPLLERGARLTVLADPHMHRILATIGGPIIWASQVGEGAIFDFQIALMSIPRVLGIRPDSVPARVPYLVAESARVAKWRERIGSRGLKVGICWQGNPAGASGRSVPLKEFAPLLKVPGVRLISLQKYHGLEQIDRLVSEVPVETFGPQFDEWPHLFLDAAAAMASLDVVVTSDTAIAHLAGALARPVCIALKRVPDWRWLMEGPTTPWYPTARLFRQARAGQWRPVFEEIAQVLRTATAESSPRSGALLSSR